jgi:hypothetical protein
MRRTTVVPLAILIFVIVMIAIGAKIYEHNEFTRLSAVQKVLEQPSAIYARLTVRYDRPPIYEEEYDMSDVEAASTYSYAVSCYIGKKITVKQRVAHEMTDVSYFFGKLVQDGIWDMMDTPVRNGADVHYTVYVKQKADFKEGDRTVSFTDPHYWATTAGRQYSIDLRKTNPNDVLKLKSTALADPRYQEVVDDFRAFGPPEFHENIARARAVCGH